MATSGTVTFRLNRDQIINQALLLVGAIDPEVGSGNATQITNAAFTLNMMVKTFETFGLELWERKYGVIFTQMNQGVYVLGSPGPFGDHSTLTSNALGYGNFLKTALSASAGAGAGSVTLTTLSSTFTPGIPVFTAATTYNIGIVLDSGITQWTTINGAPVSNVVTLTTVTSGTAAIGNTVYVYQTKLMRPLRLLDAFYRQSAGNDVPVRIISRDEYNRFGLKSSSGTAIQIYYDVQSNSGLVSMYPVPADSVGQMYIEFQKPIEDFVNSTDDFDFPQEWCEALVWNLALRLIPSYRTPELTAARIERMATQTLTQVKNWDQEQASIFFAPDGWQYGPRRG